MRGLYLLSHWLGPACIESITLRFCAWLSRDTVQVVSIVLVGAPVRCELAIVGIGKPNLAVVGSMPIPVYHPAAGRERGMKGKLKEGRQLGAANWAGAEVGGRGIAHKIAETPRNRWDYGLRGLEPLRIAVE